MSQYTDLVDLEEVNGAVKGRVEVIQKVNHLQTAAISVFCF